MANPKCGECMRANGEGSAKEGLDNQSRKVREKAQKFLFGVRAVELFAPQELDAGGNQPREDKKKPDDANNSKSESGRNAGDHVRWRVSWRNNGSSDARSSSE